jgi:hypothetical protein
MMTYFKGITHVTRHITKYSYGLSRSPSKHWVVLILQATLFCWGLTGCAGTPKPPSPLAAQINRVEQTLQQMTESYRNKDRAGLSHHLDPAFSHRSILEEQIQNDFDAFSEIAIKMNVVRIHSTKEATWATVYWEGVWTPVTGSAPPLYQSGHALFGFSKDDSPRLLEMRGDAPWGVQTMDFENE